MVMKTEYAFTYMERTKMKFKELKPLLRRDTIIVIVDETKPKHVIDWSAWEDLKPEHDEYEGRSVASALHYDYHEPESRCEIVLVKKG